MNEIKRFDIYASLSCTAMTKAEAVLNIKPDNEDGLYYLYSDVEKLNQWQPIETAPKDGAMFLLSFINLIEDKSIVVTTNWNDSINGFYLLSDLEKEGKIKITHWMPLPKPPTK